jgi:nucleoredoxin
MCHLLAPILQVKTTDAAGNKDAVALYFSAHWCGPCRGFTPQLAAQYKKLTGELGKSFEVVFVSSDKDQASFDEYYAEQPWLALPFEARDLKASLSKKYKVQGIPTLVIVDGKTSELITRDGRSAVMQDPSGAAFPWKPPTLWEALGEDFLSQQGDVSIDEIKGPGKVIGLYFSAHWCPPCKAFTPLLAETYNKVRANGKQLEIIFCSSDRDTASFGKYFGEMPWLAIPHGDKRKEALSSMFEVKGIPTLVLLDGESGEVINASGRSAVSADPEGANFPWHPLPVVDMSDDVDGINEEPSFCVMAEGCTPKEQAALLEAETALAKSTKAAGGETMLFFIATKKGQGPVSRVRELTNLGKEPPAKAQLMILDIPDDGGYYVYNGAVDAKAMGSFLAAYRAGSLSRQQLE